MNYPLNQIYSHDQTYIITCILPEVSSLMSNPLPIPAPMELIILSIWANRRERETQNQSFRDVQHVQGKSHFPVIRLTPISGFKCHITRSLRQPARWMSLIPSVNWKNVEKQKGGKKDVLEQRWRKRQSGIGGSYSGFISVWLLAVNRSSLTLDLLLSAELCDLRIHPPVRTAGPPRVRGNWPCCGWSESHV